MAKKDVKFVKITDTAEAAKVLEEYFRINAESKAIAERMESLKASIYDYMDGKQGNEIAAGDYTATRTFASRDTLIADEVEKKFNIKITDDCYRKTTYPKLSVKDDNK